MKLKKVSTGFYVLATGMLVSRVIKVHHYHWMITHLRNNRVVGQESPVATLALATQKVILKHGAEKC